MIEIRDARIDDLPAMTAIYNHYVQTTAVTFDIDAVTPEARRPWFDGFASSGRHRLFVALRDAELLGYAGSHTHRTKAAYDPSIETTIYVEADANGQGVGSQLYTTLFDALASEDVHRAYAGITLPNEASIALHLRFGFERVGVFREIGRKFVRFWDGAWLEKSL